MLERVGFGEGNLLGTTSLSLLAANRNVKINRFGGADSFAAIIYPSQA